MSQQALRWKGGSGTKICYLLGHPLKSPSNPGDGSSKNQSVPSSFQFQDPTIHFCSIFLEFFSFLAGKEVYSGCRCASKESPLFQSGLGSSDSCRWLASRPPSPPRLSVCASRVSPIFCTFIKIKFRPGFLFCILSFACLMSGATWWCGMVGEWVVSALHFNCENRKDKVADSPGNWR